MEEWTRPLMVIYKLMDASEKSQREPARFQHRYLIFLPEILVRKSDHVQLVILLLHYVVVEFHHTLTRQALSKVNKNGSRSYSEIKRALWSRTAKNTDCSTGSLARPFARSLALLARGKMNY